MTYEDIKNFLEKVVTNNNGKNTILIKDRDKLNKMILDYTSQEDLEMDDLRKVIYVFSSWCMNAVRNEQISYVNSVNEDSLKESNINFRKTIENENYTNTYKKLLLLDKKKKTSLWSDRNIFIFKFSEKGKEFLIENKVNLNNLDSYAWKMLNKNIISYEDIENNKYEQKLNDIKELCPHYFKNLDWAKTEMNSHLVTLLAIDYEHDLNQKQVVEYFELIQGKIQGKSNDDEKFNFLVNHFAEVMAHSSFFRFNVSKWKDLKSSLGKTFNVSMNNIKEYSEDFSPMKKFIFLLAENPILKHDNMKNKVENKEKMKLFGKIHLNQEEKKQYEEYLLKRSEQTKVKKIKI